MLTVLWSPRMREEVAGHESPEAVSEERDDEDREVHRAVRALRTPRAQVGLLSIPTSSWFMVGRSLAWHGILTEKDR